MTDSIATQDPPEEYPQDDPAKARLARWAGAAKRESSSVFLWDILAVAAWIAIAWGASRAISAAVNGETDFLAIGIGIAGVSLRAFSQYVSEIQSARAGRAIVSAARADVFTVFANRGARLLRGADSGTRLSQMMDRTARTFGYTARWKPGTRLALAGPVIVLIAVFTQSWLSGALMLFAVMVLPMLLVLTISGTARAAREQQAALDTLSGAFQAKAANAGLIRAFRAVGRERDRLAQESNELRMRTMRILRIAFLSTAVMEFFSSISIALVAVYVGFKLLGIFPFPTGETITLAEGMMVLILVPEYYAPIRRLSTLHHDRADATAAAGFLGPWLAAAEAEPDTIRRPTLARAPHIRFDTACLTASPDAQPVGPFSFEAAPGDITLLFGPSGSGKTTCLHALIGLAGQTAGEIFIDGRPLGADETLADSVAYLGQSPWITEGVLADTLRLARPDAGNDELLVAMRAAGVTDFTGEGPDALSRPIGRFGTGLSGGERQRVALARALLTGAPILILDEPTAHLDGDAEARFIETLDRIKSDRTVLIASHRPAIARAADRTVDLGPVRTVAGASA